MDLSPQYRFDTFAAGEQWQLALAACNAVSQGENGMGNPLVLVGATGLGKTHLLHATASAFKTKNANLKVLCITAGEFYGEFSKNLLQRKEDANIMDEMAAKYRSADLFILDDLQNIEGKIASQQELLQIFNHQLLAGKPIIVASQSPISSIENLNESLRSRLMGGLVIQIESPSYADRVAILRKKFDIISLNLEEGILNYLAERTSGSVNDLEGIVNNLSFRVRHSNRNINMDMAIEVLEEHFGNSHRSLSADAIIKTISQKYGIAVDILKLKGRGSKEAVQARQIAMFLIRSILDQSSSRIGKYFNRNHATVLHACKLVEKKIKDEMQFNLEVKNLKKSLYE
ncbi:hypothetical protein AGMMS49938_10780 [Fibrobacterales bacterium]|nr:hypothetical protein AGMMS49938_10780 [Fibrobacterales bacterium]